MRIRKFYYSIFLDCPPTSPTRQNNQYYSAQNMNTTPIHGSRHDVQYITGEITTPTRGLHPRDHRQDYRRESHDLLADRRGSQKNQKRVSEVVGLMHDNVEALMIRDDKLQSTSRRASDLEDNALARQHRAQKPKR